MRDLRSPKLELQVSQVSSAVLFREVQQGTQGRRRKRFFVLRRRFTEEGNEEEEEEELVEGELGLEALLTTTKDTNNTNNNTLKEKSIKPKPTRKFEVDSEDIHRHRLRREHFAKLALNLPLWRITKREIVGNVESDR